MADDKEGGEPHKEQAPADAHVHSEELDGRSANTEAALSEAHAHAAAAKATDAHSVDAHGHGTDAHGHGADAHGHGHDDHAIPADAIPEKSAYDAVLPMLAILVGVALVGLIVYWLSLKPAVVAEGEGAEHHAVDHAAPANTEPAPVQ